MSLPRVSLVKRNFSPQEVCNVIKMSEVSISFWNLGHANSVCVDVYLWAFYSFIYFRTSIILACCCFLNVGVFWELYGSWIVSCVFTDVWEETAEYAKAPDLPTQGKVSYQEISNHTKQSSVWLLLVPGVLARRTHWLAHKASSGLSWATTASALEPEVSFLTKEECKPRLSPKARAITGIHT